MILTEQQLLEQLTNNYMPMEDVRAVEEELDTTLDDLVAQAGESGRKLQLVNKTFETPDGELEAITLEPEFMPQRNPMSVYFMDQVLFDSEFFNQTAWKHALKYFRKVKPDA